VSPSQRGAPSNTGESAPADSAAAAAADVGPFITSECEPRPPACSRRAARSAVRATRTVVRPGRKKGGTTVVFRLSRAAVVEITVTRVYPTCERLGTFTVRAEPGTNRIRFRGHLRGRALPPGSYRLVIRARGATRDVAAIPIVIARGPVSEKALRKARRASVCTKPVADFEGAGAVLAATRANGSGGVLGQIKSTLKSPLTAAARTARKAVHGFSERVDEASDSPLGRAVLTLVGMIALASSILGAIVLARIVRAEGFSARRA
jgi:hypothetical protein